MAHLMILSTPLQVTPTLAMDHVWNISHHVGNPGHESNRPTDVELIQRLIRLVSHDYFSVPASLLASVSPNGHLDKPTLAAIRGFELCGAMYAHHAKWGVEGAQVSHSQIVGWSWRISPVRHGAAQFRKAGTSLSKYLYFMCELNSSAMACSPQSWAELASACSPALRRELEAPAHH